MINFKAYPEYKDSGVPWLGKVPNGWMMMKFRNILNPISERNRPDLPLLSVVRDKGVIIRNIKDEDENHNVIPEDLTNYKVVKIGQFTMNKMKAWQGSYGISKYNGLVSPAYFVFNLHNVESHFFHISLRSKAYIPFFTQASDGIRVGQWDLSLTRMKEIPFFIPSSSEQPQIARFLDWKTSQIAKFIKDKKRIIELLKEQKQIIINNAVTGKIDVTTGKPYPKYKDSGVEWLGQVPEGWEVKRLKYISIIIMGQSPDSGLCNINFIGIPFLQGCAEFGILNPKPIQYCLKAPKIAPVNSILLSVRAPVGKINISDQDYGIGRGLCSINPFKNNDLQFISNAINTSMIQLKMVSTGSTYESVSIGNVSNIFLSFPNHREQINIVEFIKSKTSTIDLTISRIEREISLIQEYRDRLIADAVTGKIDVRDIKVPVIEEVLDDTVNENEADETGEEDIEMVDG